MLSCEVDDDKLTDEQRSVALPDSWLYYARQSTSWTLDEPNEPELPNNPALSSSRGAAYGAELEEMYQHRIALPCQAVTMGDRNPTTIHMESKKGGRPDKVGI